MTTIEQKEGSYSTDAIANEFLSIEEAKNSVSPMKLQKLVYYAHGWHLALTGLPLVSENVQAWRYGPVFPTLYAEFRDFGKDPITRLANEVQWTAAGDLTRFEPRLSESDARAKLLVSRIWKQIGHYSALQLSTLTHQQGTPWSKVNSTEFEGGPPQAAAIPNELIRDYFRSLLNKGSSGE